jgi:hypothetical protein
VQPADEFVLGIGLARDQFELMSLGQCAAQRLDIRQRVMTIPARAPRAGSGSVR